MSLNVLRLSTAYCFVWRVDSHQSIPDRSHLTVYVTLLITQDINLTGLNSLDLQNYLFSVSIHHMMKHEPETNNMKMVESAKDNERQTEVIRHTVVVYMA